MRYFIELSYNGKAYHGWQNQPNAISVQEVVEKALSTLLKSPMTIVGAGRTDTGVHAKQMFAHFDTDLEFDNKSLTFKLNSFLPKDIAIHSIFEVNGEVHARFDAISRTYIYKLSLSKNAFTFDSAYYIKMNLVQEQMQRASSLLLNYKNFKCFSRSNSDVKTYNCDIKKAEWKAIGDEFEFTIKADRFLRNMVRAIVGTLLEIGQGKIKVEELNKIIESQDRSQAGPSVPAHGLYLMEIEYPKSIKK